MNMSIGKKLTAGFGIVIVLWVISSSVFLWQVRQIGENITEVVARTVPMTKAALEMEINLIGTGFAVGGYLNDLDPIHLERIEKDRQDFDRAQADYRKFAGTELEQDLAVQMDNGYQRFKEKAAKLVEAHKDQTTRMAVLHKLFDQLDDILDEKIQPAIRPEDPQGYKKLIATMELEINMNELAKSLGLYLTERTTHHEARIEKDSQDFYRFLEQYRALGLSKEEQQWGDETNRVFGEIIALSKAVIALEKTKMQGLEAFVKLRRELDVLLDDNIQSLAQKDLLTSEKKTAKAITRTSALTLMLVGIGTLAAIAVAVAIGRATVGPLRTLTDAAKQVQQGDLQIQAQVKSRDETRTLANAFNVMVRSLRKTKSEVEMQIWANTGWAELNERMRGDKDTPTLCGDIMSYLAEYLKAQVGTLSISDFGFRISESKESDSGSNNPQSAILRLAGSYAYKRRRNAPTEFKFGEGLIGQAAQEKQRILVTDVPEDYITVTSALGETVPRNIICFPFLYEGEVKGVIELGSLEQFTEQQLDFLDRVGEGMAIAVHSAQSREQTKILLEESQSQAEELESQQVELQAANEELEAKTAELEAQQEEMERRSRNAERGREE